MKNQSLWAFLPTTISNANNLSIGKFYDYSGKFYDYFFIIQPLNRVLESFTTLPTETNGKFYDYLKLSWIFVLRLLKLYL